MTNVIIKSFCSTPSSGRRGLSGFERNSFLFDSLKRPQGPVGAFFEKKIPFVRHPAHSQNLVAFTLFGAIGALLPR